MVEILLAFLSIPSLCQGSCHGCLDGEGPGGPGQVGWPAQFQAQRLRGLLPFMDQLIRCPAHWVTSAPSSRKTVSESMEPQLRAAK